MVEIEHIKKIQNNFLQFIELGKSALQWDDINSELKLVTKKIKISNTLKLILTSTGSVTKALEILSENPIYVKTIFQNIGDLEIQHTDLLHLLKLNVGEPCNFREVWLTDNHKNYVFSISLTPLKYLKNEFKEDLIRADIPIGKLIEMHHIECRREIFNISTIEYIKMKNLGIIWEDLEDTAVVPYRMYNIISEGNILMCILEFFHPQIK
jgi:chorismate-pyruvate lyase